MTRCYKKSDDKTAAATDGSNKKKLTIANELKTAFATNLCVSEEDIEKIICQGQRPGKLSARERELAGAFHRLGMQPLLFTWCSPKWRISVPVISNISMYKFIYRKIQDAPFNLWNNLAWSFTFGSVLSSALWDWSFMLIVTFVCFLALERNLDSLASMDGCHIILLVAQGDLSLHTRHGADHCQKKSLKGRELGEQSGNYSQGYFANWGQWLGRQTLQ
jgi:hypothetical protein